ncbi:hypothetical protein HG536_0F03760 [Torulaspora globosa]|uniref:Endonuclease/exonuclease/phosphatase domain-containing protein n=1 Tax=Torulaspora globosa TaxID=48254 RepID=A0A7G3ZKL5_9SACH|nr:uncharacterized protein HG536_0F03760 [Torulaspora globosa]QLL34051.1 hypothetical protein HG536_0F03760 [Torulaspora globosa]
MLFGRRLLPIKKIASNLRRNSSKTLIDDKFTLLTYNLLSPYYMWPQVYTYVPDEYKDWKYRHRLLENELLSRYRADIMCLQELTATDYYQYWEPVIDRDFNYGSKYIAKPPPQYWKREPSDMDGVGIFYNLNKFDYISSSSVYLNDLIGSFDLNELSYLKSKMVKLTDGAGNPTGEQALLEVLRNRNQVGLFVSLKHKDTGTIFVVVNTHLYWKYDEVKLTQCIIIMRRLAKIINTLLVGEHDTTYSKMKVLFAGDLNSPRDSSVVKFLRGEIVKYDNLDIANPLRPYLNRCVFEDVSADLFEHTCYSGKLKGIFDYIWYHNKDFELTKILSGADVSKELRNSNEFGLPNKNHPSDHIPVLGEFKIL